MNPTHHVSHGTKPRIPQLTFFGTQVFVVTLLNVNLEKPGSSMKCEVLIKRVPWLSQSPFSKTSRDARVTYTCLKNNSLK